MKPHTAPHEFFREIVETQSLIRELWKSDITHIHWPSFYRFYVEMDRLYWRVNGAANSLVDRGFKEFPMIEEDHRNSINAYFSSLKDQQTNIVRWLSNFGRRDEMVELKDKSLRYRMQCHFQPKSNWLNSFFEDYSSGTVTTDGLTLERTIQLLDPVPIYRIEDILEKNLIQRQSFDLATEEARLTLRDIGHEAAKLVANVGNEMGELLVQRCTIKELLHPSTF